MQRHRGVKGNLVFGQALPPKNPMVGCCGRWRRAASGHVAAATGGALPGFTWLYVALARFPVSLSPLPFTPLARRLKAGAGKPEIQGVHS